MVQIKRTSAIATVLVGAALSQAAVLPARPGEQAEQVPALVAEVGLKLGSLVRFLVV